LSNNLVSRSSGITSDIGLRYVSAGAQGVERGNIRSDAIRGPNSPLMALLIAATIPHATTSRWLAVDVVFTERALNEPGPPDLTSDQMKRPRQANGMVKALSVMSHLS